MADDINFIPGAGKSSEDTQPKNNQPSESVSSRYPVRAIGIALVVIVLYAVGMYVAEYVFLSQPIQELQSRKTNLEQKHADIRPKTSSVSSVVATSAALATERRNVAELFRLVKEQPGFQTDPSTITYVGQQNELQMKVRASSVSALNKHVERIQTQSMVESASFGSIKKAPNGDQSSTLTITFR
jgi:Tfp pilus assembly protein PilN